MAAEVRHEDIRAGHGHDRTLCSITRTLRQGSTEKILDFGKTLRKVARG